MPMSFPKKRGYYFDYLLFDRSIPLTIILIYSVVKYNRSQTFFSAIFSVNKSVAFSKKSSSDRIVHQDDARKFNTAIATRRKRQ